jgi:hypothetical protein
MTIKEKFLELTTRTYPHGTEEELFKYLPDCLETDEFGNRYIEIGETTTMFTSHLDTATPANEPITHVIDGDMIKTDGTTILGADDKAGVVIMLHMIENNIPGLYYFFLGEEVGCVGSREVSDKYKTTKPEYIKKVISFDRRALHSVITFQSSSRCCSDVFGKALAEAINAASLLVLDNDTVFAYETDPSGIYTDSAQFTSIYPECTNISVGYYEEHTHRERQNIKHLDKLAKTCLLIDWESLPIVRDPSVKEYQSYSGYGYGAYAHGYSRYDGEDWDDEYYGYSYNRNRTHIAEVKDEKKYFIDHEYDNWASSITVDKDNKVKAIEFSTKRLDYERNLIIELFENLDVVYREINWTGQKLIVLYETIHTFTDIPRHEIAEHLPELNFWEFEVINQKNDDIFETPGWIM